MKLLYITSVLTWTIVLAFDGSFSSNSYTLSSGKEDNIYVLRDNNWFKSSKFSNDHNSFSTRKKRQVDVQIGGIQHVFESPQRSYGNQNLGNSPRQMEFGGSTPSELSGNIAPSDSMTTVPLLSQNPEVSIEQTASKSFSGIDKWSQAQRSDSAMPNALNKYASLPPSSQMAEAHPQTTAQDHLRSDSLMENLYNKDERLNSPSQTEVAHDQSYSPNRPDNFPSDPMADNLPNKDRSLISPSQTEQANIQNIPQEHLSSDSAVFNPSRDGLLMSPSEAQKTYIENTSHEHFHTDPNLSSSSLQTVEPHNTLPLGDLSHFHTINPNIDDIMAHPFTSHVGDPTLEPSNPHMEPVIHTDSGPQVINPLGPDNLHIIKKFYPLPVVQKVPKPIPVMVTKPVPYSVHQTRFQHVPQPYPQPFSKPDVHLSYIHLDNRANPCKHGGIIVQSPGGYACLCRKAYKGKHCQERDKCYPYPCENNGDCIDHGTHYECRCPRGFKGINCEVADKCHNHPCRNDAKCIQLLSDIKCVCSPGYKGKYCEDIDHCHPNPCRHGGKCEELNQAASCSCTAGFKGSRCQVPKTCSQNLCHNGATCMEDKPSSPCLCAPGFSGRYCTEDVCLPNPCQHNGKCYPIRSDVNTTWYPACKCSATYKGILCQVSNPCASNPSPCVHGTCYDAYTNVDQVEIPPEGYTCHCYEGYFGINCQYRKCDHCDVNARCLDGFKCTCNEGYQGDGQDCQKIPDPCAPNPCRNEGLCKAEFGTYECKCVPGFKGKTCQEKTPCSSVVSPCRNGGTCIEAKNDFRCICTREWKGKDCSENATSLCIGNRCLNGGTCRVSEDGKSWYCVCRGPRFKPPDCACNCPANAHVPVERNLTCNNPQGLCECPPGYEHHKGRDVCTDERAKVVVGKGERGCDPNPCKNGGKCVSLTSSKWMCQCTQGWSGKICDVNVPIEKNSSCAPNPCENVGLCSIVNGAAVCACPEGFLPPLCELKGRTACSPNPCVNAGRCVRAGKRYDCICDQRFTGPNCEVDRCKKCDPVNAVCKLGQCSCKAGFVGNGYQCLPGKKVNVCIMCHPVKAVCVENNCQCKSGYVGNGYQCTETHPGTVHYPSSSSNQQVPWFKRDGIL